MSFTLMFRDRRFTPLMGTQFFGALNDNVLKNALVVLIAFKSVQMGGLKPETLVTLATLIFILPYFLFSALAGQMADKFFKDQLIRIIKVSEILIMLLAAAGFYFEIYEILFVALFLMGIHSTFFGPLKYSSLPDLVTHEHLTTANAYVEVGTFIAILLGTILGGYLISIDQGIFAVTLLMIFNSIVGYYFSRKIPVLRPADSELCLDAHLFRPTVATIKLAQKNKSVFYSVVGISWFWLVGAIVLSLLPTITKMLLHGNEHIVTLFLAMFTLGIANGALLCDKLSHDKIEIGLVPLGLLGMSIFLGDFSFVLSIWHASLDALEISHFISQTNAIRLLIDLFAVATFGGVFTVPLYTLLQDRSEKEIRSRIISANNILNACFMVLGSGLLMVLLQQGIPFHQIIFSVSILNILIGIFIFKKNPEFWLRFTAWIKRLF